MRPSDGDTVAAFRRCFPLLTEAGASLHYLDNAATTHKPEAVLAAIDSLYRHSYGPVHRGLYPLAETASERYEQARARVAGFLGAPAARSVVFTRSATDSINAVAQGWAAACLQPGERIWVSRLEHHANFLPWQRLCRQAGAELGVIELTEDGRLDLAATPDLFAPGTRLIAVSLVANALGVVNDLAELIERAHRAGIAVLVDAAQAVGHRPVDVAALDCDFLAFSAHKCFGPTGLGVLYVHQDRLPEMTPWLVGGGMVDWVGTQDSEWSPPPAGLEAGSANLAGAVGLAAALDVIDQHDLAVLHRHSTALAGEARARLAELDAIQLYGGGDQDSGIVAFNIDGVHPHDVAQLAAEQGVAVRAGHHCCQPLMASLGVDATVRASFAPYNTAADVDALVAAVAAARDLFLV